VNFKDQMELYKHKFTEFSTRYTITRDSFNFIRPLRNAKDDIVNHVTMVVVSSKII